MARSHGIVLWFDTLRWEYINSFEIIKFERLAFVWTVTANIWKVWFEQESFSQVWFEQESWLKEVAFWKLYFRKSCKYLNDSIMTWNTTRSNYLICSTSIHESQIWINSLYDQSSWYACELEIFRKKNQKSGTQNLKNSKETCMGTTISSLQKKKSRSFIIVGVMFWNKQLLQNDLEQLKIKSTTYSPFYHPWIINSTYFDSMVRNFPDNFDVGFCYWLICKRNFSNFGQNGSFKHSQPTGLRKEALQKPWLPKLVNKRGRSSHLKFSLPWGSMFKKICKNLIIKTLKK